MQLMKYFFVLILTCSSCLSHADCQDNLAKTKIEVHRLDGDIEHKDDPNLYSDGLKLLISISKLNPNGQELIIDTLRLNSKFYPGKRPNYSDQACGDCIYGAGPGTNREFLVNLQGQDIDSAIWTNGLKAKSLNFLDTSDSNFNAIKIKGTDTALINGTVLANKTGLYDITLDIGYSEGTTKGKCLSAKPIHVYYEEQK
jgi:hypothetical protein